MIILYHLFSGTLIFYFESLFLFPFCLPFQICCYQILHFLSSAGQRIGQDFKSCKRSDKGLFSAFELFDYHTLFLHLIVIICNLIRFRIVSLAFSSSLFAILSLVFILVCSFGVSCLAQKSLDSAAKIGPAHRWSREKSADEIF